MPRRQPHVPSDLESVWDYPLPPAVEDSPAHAQVIVNGFLIADSARTKRVLQTGLPPVHYFPPDDVRMVYLRDAGSQAPGAKGAATHYDVVVGDRTVPEGAWSFHEPADVFALLKDYIAFYPSRMDACLLDGEPVRVDREDESGGWVTTNILGLSRGYPREWDRGAEG
jgi:uncharacterized protein (DUF427 family)